MTWPSSSTAAPDEVRPQRGLLVRSADTEHVSRTSAVVPVSAQALTTTAFVQLEDFPAALKKHLATTDVAAGVVTCRYTEHSGWLILKSPTRHLMAEPLQRVDTLPGAAEWLPYERQIAFLDTPTVTTLRIIDVAAASQPLTSPSAFISSTDAALGVSRLVESKFTKALALAAHEWFEDGVESRFSQTLSSLLLSYGYAVISEVETFLSSPSANSEVAVEAAQWLGDADHPASHRYRKALLEKLLLTTPSPRIRHGAAAGLASMDDPSSLSALVPARDRETNRRLRRYLEMVIEQLERTRACLSS